MGDEPRRATAAATDVIVREIRVRARPEAIWAFLVEPENLKRWKGVEVELDVRPGGVRRVDIHGGRDIATGEHVVVEPYGRLVFTWGWEGNEQLPPGSSTVEVTLTPDGDETVVLLEHRDLPTPQDRAMHGAGWCTAWPSRRRGRRRRPRSRSLHGPGAVAARGAGAARGESTALRAGGRDAEGERCRTQWCTSR